MQLAVTSILVSFALFVGFSVLTALSFSEYQQSLLEDEDELEFQSSLTFKQKVMINISALSASWFFVFGTILVLIKTYMYFKGL